MHLAVLIPSPDRSTQIRQVQDMRQVQVESRKPRRPARCVLQVRFVRLSFSQAVITAHRECFSPLMTTKFKRILEPAVNPATNRARRKALKAEGNLFLAFSGGLGSTVLLDLVSQCYFKPSDEDNENPRGGRNHPRNGNVWERVFVCYVETCSTFPEVRESRVLPSFSATACDTSSRPKIERMMSVQLCRDTRGSNWCPYVSKMRLTKNGGVGWASDHLIGS